MEEEGAKRNAQIIGLMILPRQCAKMDVLPPQDKKRVEWHFTKELYQGSAL